MIGHRDPAGLSDAERRAELASTFARGSLRALARRRGENRPEALDEPGAGEASCPPPMATRTAAEGTSR